MAVLLINCLYILNLAELTISIMTSICLAEQFVGTEHQYLIQVIGLVYSLLFLQVGEFRKKAFLRMLHLLMTSKSEGVGANLDPLLTLELQILIVSILPELAILIIQLMAIRMVQLWVFTKANMETLPLPG